MPSAWSTRMVGTGARPPGEKSFKGGNQTVQCLLFFNSEDTTGFLFLFS